MIDPAHDLLLGRPRDGGIPDRRPPPPREPETRIVPCARCNGDQGWHVPVGIDRRDGSLVERWEDCGACNGSGEEEVEVEPVTEAEAMCADMDAAIELEALGIRCDLGERG